MENLVELLRSESTSEYVAYTEFMLEYKKNTDTLYCFFEGFEDRVYYSIRIKNISKSKNYIDYICGGKDEVIKTHELLKANRHYSSAKTGFFIDKDFDENDQPDSIYITPTYSIENLYCSKEVVEDILVAEFKMKRGDEDFKKAIEIYLHLQNIFLNEISLLNAWLSCQADYRRATGTTRLKIDTKMKGMFDKLVSPDLQNIKNIPEIQTKEAIEILFNEAPSVSNDDLFKKVAQLRSINGVEYCRGKFLIRYLESFINRLQAISGVATNPLKGTYSCSLRIEHATICSNLSQYAITPACLKEYITKNS